MSQSDYSYRSLPKEIALKIASSLEIRLLALSHLIFFFFFWYRLFLHWVVVLGNGKRYAGRIVYGSRFLKKDGLFYTKLIKTLTSSTKRRSVKLNPSLIGGTMLAIRFTQGCRLSACDRLPGNDAVWFQRCSNAAAVETKAECSVNLIGLHYCLNNLQVPAFHITEALWSGKIADRQVCVKWRQPYNFRPRWRSNRCVYLKDVVKGEDDGQVLTVLERGVTYELSGI
ncbi:hypothetical protein CXB51_025762 [Gossypium anomalum]|uniref:Uncharacterized protein n=1 Tax=Gossypium anomalum TaxID=47600 RepID=A0A8J5YEH6_9ROSI|nr:hypothetical protein CXB51_025762 [Gossypium anomalum]